MWCSALTVRHLIRTRADDLSLEHAKWLVNKKAELKKKEGVAYFSNLLDKLKIEQGVANRAMMADYLDPKRFVPDPMPEKYEPSLAIPK